MKKFIDPTIEQVAWVFHKINENAGNGSCRYIIYGPEAYLPLYEAGGMKINNAFYKDIDEKI